VGRLLNCDEQLLNEGSTIGCFLSEIYLIGGSSDSLFSLGGLKNLFSEVEVENWKNYSCVRKYSITMELLRNIRY
jgi:hypothetical protein